MATYVPAKKNTAFIFYASLVSQANTKIMQVNPTLAAGDFNITGDGVSVGAFGTTPAVTPAASRLVKFSLASGEMNYDNVTITCSDAAGAEWCDLVINIQTAARQVDDLAYPATSGRSLVVDANGLADANAVKCGATGAGTAITARDIGASVLLSAGSGTGQLDFTSGVVKGNLAQILGTALTETAGLLAGGFKKFFNIASPTGTLNSLPDAVPDAAGGLPVTGTRLTSIPWNAAWDTEVQSECDDALVAQNLDHLVKIAVDTNLQTTVHDNSVLGYALATANVSTFDRTTESLAGLSGDLNVGIADIQADTDNIQARIPAALTAGGNMKSDLLAQNGSTTAADNIRGGGLGLVLSTCAAGSTTTSIVTNLTEATNDHYNGRVITFTNAALLGQTSSISAYDGATKTLTVVALTEAPANTDTFVIS